MNVFTIAHGLRVAGILSLSLCVLYALSRQYLPTGWLVFSIALTLGGFLIKRAALTPFHRHVKEVENAIAQLKTSGEKIKINLAECEVRGSSYTEEEILNQSVHGGIQSIINPQSNIQQVSVSQSVITCKVLVEGEEMTFHSGILDKDHISLQFLLANQKETFVYLDKDSGSYYFDLEFLN